MRVTVKRLHELMGGFVINVQAVSLALRDEIQPASVTEGSSWVCQRLQRPHFWGTKAIENLAETDKDGVMGMAWVGFVRNRPAGFCWVCNEDEDRMLGMFLVNTSYSQKEQWEIADAIALKSITEMLADDCPAKRNFYGWFPEKGWAADYARRCGFKSERPGKYMGTVPDPNPLLLWTIGMEQLKRNIEEKRGNRNV